MSNGSTFDAPMTADVKPTQRVVQLTVGTSVSETVAAQQAGHGVRFYSRGPTSITEMTLEPAGDRNTRVSARVIRGNAVLATGIGILIKNS